MSETTWQRTWSPFRLRLLEQTAPLVSDALAQAAGDDRLAWRQLNDEQRRARVEYTAIVFLAQDEAMRRLDELREIL